jgi:hypothetical protein
MSILNSILGQYGGATGAAKAGNQMSILQMLGLGAGPNQGPMPDGSVMPNISGQEQDSSLANLASRLGTWGAGVSQASGPSRTPVDFGQALAGGQQALDTRDQQQLGNMKTVAEIGALRGKGAPDFDAQAQQILIKKNQGLPLTPQEEALAQSYDSFAGSKLQTVTMPDGTIRQVPSQRPVFGDLSQRQGQGQQQRPPLSSFMR